MQTLKISLPLIAAVLGLGLSAFTSKSSPLATKDYAVHYFELTDPSNPLKGDSYTEISEMAYNNISCPTGDNQTCKLQATSSTLPSDLADSDGNDIPDVTGVIENVSTKQ